MGEDKSILTRLEEAIDDTLKTSEVLEIRLAVPVAKDLGEELAEKTGTRKKVHVITSILGIPVVVDSAVPVDKMWVLKKREIEV
jgi:hypothetical protein